MFGFEMKNWNTRNFKYSSVNEDYSAGGVPLAASFIPLEVLNRNFIILTPFTNCN